MMVRNAKMRAVSTLAFVAVAGTVGGLVASTPQAAQAQAYRYRQQQRRHPIERTGLIPWSAAQGQPAVRGGKSTGFYIWHDRNTVHIVSSDRTSGRDIYSGSVEIAGRNSDIDSLRNEHDEKDDRFSLIGNNKVTFRFDTHQSKDGFAFNLHDGERLIFRLDRDGRKTARIFYGAQKIQTYGDPVIFDLKR